MGPGLLCGWGLSQSSGWGHSDVSGFALSRSVLSPDGGAGQGQEPSSPQALERERDTRPGCGRGGWSGRQGLLLAEPPLSSAAICCQGRGRGSRPLLVWAPGSQAENRVGQGRGLQPPLLSVLSVVQRVRLSGAPLGFFLHVGEVRA